MSYYVILSYSVSYLIVILLLIDGIVGEVLFWVLRQVLGAEMYSHTVHMAWVKVYNRMLSIIVPKAVALEVRRGASEEHDDRLQHHQLAMFPASAMKPTSMIADMMNCHLDSCSSIGEGEDEFLVCESLRQQEPTYGVDDCPFHRTSWSATFGGIGDEGENDQPHSVDHDRIICY